MYLIDFSLSLVVRLLCIWVGVLAIAYLMACLYLLLRQQYFIFKPPTVIRTTPAAFNLKYQDVWLPVSTASGQISPIHGWWVPATAPEAPVWLFLHGNGSTIGDEVKRPFWFHQLGFSCLLIDYRGYGRSQGRFPTESSVYADVEAAWKYLTQNQQIPPSQIFVYGHSLGGALAIDLALKHPEIGGLAVEGSFTTMRSMVDHLYRQFGIFPVDWLLHQKFDSLKKVSSLSMPVLFIHGTDDRLIPAQMSQSLFEAASEPKKLLLVPEAGHHNVGELGSESYFQAIQWVVDQAQAKFVQLAEGFP
jgi:pimeloyl-ACP methyl ester carboxylesterase